MTTPTIVPLHTRFPTFDDRTRQALARSGEVTYTPEEVRRIMAEAILAEREACAQIAEHWTHEDGSAAGKAREIRDRSAS